MPDPVLLTRTQKLDDLQEAEKQAQIANGFSVLEATTIAAVERLFYELQSDAWLNNCYDRHVNGNNGLPLLGV